MTLTIRTPLLHTSERDYILDYIFGEVFGLKYRIIHEDRRNVEITLPNTPLRLLVHEELLLSEKSWLKEASLPRFPLKEFHPKTIKGNIPFPDRIEDPLPVLYGKTSEEETYVTFSNDACRIDIDIFGTCFFMLSRYEECILKEVDCYNRFPARISTALKGNFLYRPIVNEYFELLWSCLAKCWPFLKRKERSFEVIATHDMDVPFDLATISLLRLSKRVVLDMLLLRQPLKTTLRKPFLWYRIKKGAIELDPFNNLDDIMDTNERHGVKTIFFFLTDHSAGPLDCLYEIDHPFILSLVKRIHERGHEIGLHASFYSYNNREKLVDETERLKKVCKELHIDQKHFGSRQHFLRWSTPITFQLLNDAGLQFDTTLYYPEAPGFRCGICYPYPTFNVLEGKKLNLYEIPLIFMESSFFDATYSGISGSHHLLKTALTLKEQCKKFQGIFMLLWHNTSLLTPRQWDQYKSLLEG